MHILTVWSLLLDFVGCADSFWIVNDVALSGRVASGGAMRVGLPVALALVQRQLRKDIRPPASENM